MQKRVAIYVRVSTDIRYNSRRFIGLRAAHLPEYSDRRLIGGLWSADGIQIFPAQRLADEYKQNETGQNPNARELIMQVQNGQLVTVWPEQYASTKPMLPFRQ
jgi:hypothetical protein